MVTETKEQSGPGTWTFHVEVSTDCGCGGAESVLLRCEGLTAAKTKEQSGPGTWTFHVEVSTDCGCSGAELVLLRCEGLTAAMVAGDDAHKLRVEEERYFF
ncbi:hypothetical protein GOP47_0030702 [Adiantum capillus-veneris]|nr:hypothetical protein GOP47_0030702 [Adiantum capillus-veneris]